MMRMTQQRSLVRAEPNKPSQAGLVRLDGVRVLLVDDEQDTRNLLTVILGQSGALVTTAAGVAEALESLRLTKYDVLFSEL